MKKVSAVIITKNNEQTIQDCLTSILWADEIVIVDSGSTDKTIEICKSFNCKIVSTPWLGFGKTKQLAVNNASNEWIFSIDSDEVCSPALRDKIMSVLENSEYDGYTIKRTTFYLGKPIKYCGWQRDFPLRLFNKEKGTFNERPIHEYVELNGSIGRINSILYHYSFPTLSSHFQKMDSYTDLSAEEAYSEGKKSSIVAAVLNGVFKFIKMYFLKLGLLDGTAGFVLCKNSAFGVYLKHLKIYELGHS
jgi:glycosyltransferase involved in cell wall biosynthesis